MAPVSKINASGAPYGLLDYAYATPNTIKRSWLLWRAGISDHAVLVNYIQPEKGAATKKAKTCKWKPADLRRTDQLLQHCPIYVNDTLQEVCHKLMLVQDSVQDKRTCKNRSQARVPADVRLLWDQIAQAAGDQRKNACSCQKKARSLPHSYKTTYSNRRTSKWTNALQGPEAL